MKIIFFKNFCLLGLLALSVACKKTYFLESSLIRTGDSEYEYNVGRLEIFVEGKKSGQRVNCMAYATDDKTNSTIQTRFLKKQAFTESLTSMTFSSFTNTAVVEMFCDPLSESKDNMKVQIDRKVLENAAIVGGGGVVAPTAPNAPTNLFVNESVSQLNLSWTDTSSDEDNFVVERSESGTNMFIQLAQVSANITSYADTTVAPNTLYDYRVKATRGSLSSAYADIATGISFDATPPSLLMLFTLGPNQINLTWSNVTDETGYEVERSSVGISGPFSLITTTATDVFDYSDTTVTTGVTYYYRVRSLKGSFSSSYSPVESATTP